MHGKEEGVIQPPGNSVAAPRPASMSPVILPREYRAPHHAVQSLQHQAQMPANVDTAAAGNGLPFQQFPAYHTQWQAMHSYLRSNKIEHRPHLPASSGISRPPSATSATALSTGAARQPPQSTIYIGDCNTNLNIHIPQPEPGVSVAQPSTVAEYLSITGNNGMRNAGHTYIPRYQCNPILFHQKHQHMLHRQHRVREYQQHQLQQQRQQPLPPLPVPMPLQQQQPQQQQLRQQYAQRPPPLPRAPFLPSRPPLPSSFLNDVSLAGHPQVNNTHGIAPRPQLPRPTQRSVFIAAPSVPSPPPPAPIYIPDAHPSSAVRLAAGAAAAGAAPDLLFSHLGDGLYPNFEDMGLLPNAPLELTDALSFDEYSPSHIVAANQNIFSLQAEQAQHAQQQVMESIRNLPIPMEIEQQINAGAVAGMTVPTADGAGGGGGVPTAAVEAPSTAFFLVSEEEIHDIVTADEASRQKKLQRDKERHRREQQTENKRKQRQRYKDEEEAGRNAVIQALEAAQNELANLRLSNARLILSSGVNESLMLVRNAMLNVFHLEEEKEEEGKSDFAREEQVRDRLLGPSAVPTPEIVATKEVNGVGNPSSNAFATVIAEEKEKENNTQNPSSPLPPPPRVPSPLPQSHQPDSQQLNTFEIAESLAHIEIDACLSYTRQFLIDVKLSVEEAFDDNLPPELVASIENSIKKGRSVYKRVLEERKDIYYAHVCRLSENAIVGAAKTKEAAALLLKRGISTAQLLELRETVRKFQDADTFARNNLVTLKMAVNPLLQTLENTINTAAAGGVCHAIQARHNVEVTSCVQKWEHFSSMRQNFMVRLEEIFFQIMGPFNYAIVLYKSNPCFPNWGRVIEDIVTMAVQRKLIPAPER
ncbi:hypothetical protein NADE_000780 [Nannochloris sp. 'desiccata']|nr:hypothetical protein KSW81_003710 [Chlorella desiccata (nom. nud.)]KAH7615943.1 hypothetical protein NADE_000780 [Chlorella desiccata (nom. nud.)]